MRVRTDVRKHVLLRHKWCSVCTDGWDETKAPALAQGKEAETVAYIPWNSILFGPDPLPDTHWKVNRMLLLGLEYVLTRVFFRTCWSERLRAETWASPTFQEHVLRRVGACWPQC